LRCVGISKFFSGVRALHRVSLELFPGQVVALVGDNGAGKSTLVKILSGLYQPDEGQLWFGSERFDRLSARRTRQLGVEVVYQHLSLCDNLGTAANVVLGQEPVRWQIGPLRLLDEERARAEARQRISEIGVVLDDLTVPVRRLSGGQRQAVAIARALVHAPRLLLLDEPTAALGVNQTRATLELIRCIAARSIAVVLITHNLDDVFAVAQRIIALRLGQISLDVPTASASRATVVAAMTGVSLQAKEPA
jgi:ABC-type sugar transport system ATPase subunit